MTHRERYIHYVRTGEGALFCSPQIGAGAGFDTKLAGKTWISQTTPQDTLAACQAFDILPLYNFGLPDLGQLTGGAFGSESSRTFDTGRGRYTTRTRFQTPHGTLESEMIEEELKGVCPTKYLAREAPDLAILEYYLDALLEARDFSPITRGVAALRALVGEDEALDVQWAMQPYELLGFPSTMDTVLFHLDQPERCGRIMEKILGLNERLLPAVKAGGADFVFLGGPGSEMISPSFYEEYLIPYSSTLSQMAHQHGLLIYSHICSPIEPMLSLGYYNRMGIDLFETLSEAPVGNVKSFADAMEKLDPALCTRGNIGLERLLEDTPQQIYDRSLDILQTARRLGRKHILAASDYLFYQTPPENVRAMARAVADFGKG